MPLGYCEPTSVLSTHTLLEALQPTSHSLQLLVDCCLNILLPSTVASTCSSCLLFFSSYFPSPYSFQTNFCPLIASTQWPPHHPKDLAQPHMPSLCPARKSFSALRVWLGSGGHGKCALTFSAFPTTRQQLGTSVPWHIDNGNVSETPASIMMLWSSTSCETSA